MSELLDIIISAVDNASDVFRSVEDSVNETSEALQDSFNGDEFENMNSALQEANAEVERLSEELAGIYMGDIEGDADAVEAALASAQEEAARLKDEMDNTGGSTSEASNEMEGLAGIIGSIAGVEIFSELSDALMDVADKAGGVQDSFSRMELSAEGAGIPIGSMKDSVSSLSDETGRAGGKIRESFINMSAAGVTSLDSMESLFKGASGQAFILNKDVNQLTTRYSNLAMRANISNTMLKGTGITMDEVAEAMGMTGATAEEVADKWKTLDTDQKAAILGAAASMNEGKDANDEYKTSWQGLRDQIDIAKGKIEVLAGKVLLPVLIPVLETAGRILDWVGDTLSAAMDGPFGGFISIIGSVAAAIAVAIPAFMAIKGAITLLQLTVIPAAGSLWTLVAPLLPFIAIGAAVVLIIYEIGKAFGWWDDVGGMLDAIWAGLQKLWDAFINHPDVQAAIQMLSDAWKWLSDAIGEAWQAVLDFFNINESSNFDFVQSLIEAVGQAWDTLKSAIGFVIDIVSAAGDKFNEFKDTVTNVWNAVMTVIGPYVAQIQGFFTGIMTTIDQFRNGQLDLPGFVWSILTQLISGYGNAVLTIGSLLLQFGSTLLQYGIRAGRNLVNGVMQWLRGLAGRVYSALLGVVGRIRSAIHSWITAAVAKVREWVSNVTAPFRDVAGKITSGLSGVVDAVTKPFRDAWNNVKPYVDQIKGGIDTIGNITGFWGGESAYGGETAVDTTSGRVFDVGTGGFVVGDRTVDVNQNITISFKDVPPHIDTEQLISAVTDRNVLRAIASSNEFQDADASMKNRINLKGVRARGR